MTLTQAEYYAKYKERYIKYMNEHKEERAAYKKTILSR